MLAAAAAGSALLAIGVVGGYLLRDVLRIGSNSGGNGMMSGMMGVDSADMNRYMDLFNRHTEIRRTVEQIAGGVRTTTESDSPDLVAQLQAHPHPEGGERDRNVNRPGDHSRYPSTRGRGQRICPRRDAGHDGRDDGWLKTQYPRGMAKPGWSWAQAAVTCDQRGRGG